MQTEFFSSCGAALILTYPSGVRGGATGVHKRALEVEREHIGRLAGVDERLYGVQPGPLAHGHRTRPANPGPLVSAYDSFGGVTPIVFGYQAEASDGACDLIKALAEAWAPDLAERYVIDSAEAAVGVATDLLREEIGAAVLTQGAGDNPPRPPPVLHAWTRGG